jgi:hypothetical protein
LDDLRFSELDIVREKIIWLAGLGEVIHIGGFLILKVACGSRSKEYERDGTMRLGAAGNRRNVDPAELPLVFPFQLPSCDTPQQAMEKNERRLDADLSMIEITSARDYKYLRQRSLSIPPFTAYPATHYTLDQHGHSLSVEFILF